MGTVPSPPTFSPGESAGVAAKLNQLRDSINFWASPPRCYAHQNAVTSIPTSSSYTVIPLQTELYDVVQSGDSPMHDNATNNSRVVFRTPGTYEVSGQLTFASSTGGRRAADVRLNAAGVSGGGTRIGFSTQGPLSGNATSVPIPVFEVTVVAGDYIELFASQDSGGAVNTVASQVDTFLRVRLIAG